MQGFLISQTQIINPRIILKSGLRSCLSSAFEAEQPVRAAPRTGSELPASLILLLTSKTNLLLCSATSNSRGRALLLWHRWVESLPFGKLSSFSVSAMKPYLLNNQDFSPGKAGPGRSAITFSFQHRDAEGEGWHKKAKEIVSKDYSVSDTQWPKSSTAGTIRLQTPALPQSDPVRQGPSTAKEMRQETSSAASGFISVFLSYGITVRIKARGLITGNSTWKRASTSNTLVKSFQSW